MGLFREEVVVAEVVIGGALAGTVGDTGLQDKEINKARIRKLPVNIRVNFFISTFAARTWGQFHYTLGKVYKVDQPVK